MNPTTDILEKRFAMMQGGAASLALSSGTAACFNTIINLAEQGDNFVSARNLYGGTFTQFNDILPVRYYYYYYYVVVVILLLFSLSLVLSRQS